jgi:hypothetical protein
MTTPAELAPFHFETAYDTRAVRPELGVARRSKLGVTEDQLFVVFGVFGVACLFWRYTIALGAMTLAVTTFLWTMRQRSRALRTRYESLDEPAQIVHVTLTESGYALRGEDFFAEAKWSSVVNALELDGYLLVQGWRMPRLYLPIDELTRAGVYERVRAIVDVRSAARREALAAIKARQ